MPKYTPVVEKAKAIKNAQKYIDCDLNQSAMARALGKHPSTINRTLNRSRPIVQKTFSKLLDKVGLTDSNLAKGLQEGRLAVRPDPLGPGILPDYNCRHKYIVTCLELKGHLKHNGNGKGLSIVNIIYGYRNNQSNDSTIRAIETKPAQPA